MSVPKYNELFNPLLTALADGKIHPLKEIRSEVAESMHLSDEDLAERLPSGTNKYNDRINWANTYLKKAGLIRSPERAKIQITEEGEKLLSSGTIVTLDLLQSTYPEFSKFYIGSKKDSSFSNKKIPQQSVSSTMQNAEESPQETLERVYAAINDQLAEELLEEIMNQTPAFFENLVVDLMKSMGYGEGTTTRETISSDGGIDGIMYEDRLGFDLIYIQAKRWDPDKTVGRPVLQAFAGAMMGPPKVDKGLFITTAHFSKEAKQYADDQHIILIDGRRLSELMVEYDVGVTTQKTYRIKRIDSDYFSES